MGRERKRILIWFRKAVWGSIVQYFGWDDILALLLAILGGIYYWVDLNPAYPRFNEFYINIHSQLIGIGIIVIIIGTADQIIRTQFEKQRLILQMSSPYSHFACEAVRQLRDRGWLVDGTLQKATLNQANLQEADLTNADLAGASFRKADLSGVSFPGANLSGCDFKEADLSGANLLGANLREGAFFRTRLVDANLWRADLSQAMFWESDLTGAKLAGKKLGRAETLAGTILPDGTRLSEAAWKSEFEAWCQEQPR